MSEPRGPLVSTARAASASDSTTQPGRCGPGSPSAPGSAARQKAKQAPHTNSANTTSVSIMRAMTENAMPVASTRPASSPARSPNARRPKAQVSSTSSVAASAPGRRAASSLRPSAENDRHPSQ